MTAKRSGPEYETHDYTAYNAAVNRELNRISEQTGQYRLGRFRATAIVFCWFALGLAILMIGFSIAHGFWNSSLDSPAMSSAPNHNAQLNQLDENSDQSDALIQTNFVVFDRAMTAQGDLVYTAKEYNPEDLKVPIKQFCYMQSPQDVDTKVTLAVKQPELEVAPDLTPYQLQEGLPLCTFI